MEPVSTLSLTLASILSTLPVNGDSVSQMAITTHISPAIAGQWEIDLSDDISSPRTVPSIEASQVRNEPQVQAGMVDGVLGQNVQRTLRIVSDSDQNNTAITSQCREFYNFGTDNEMWAVSGKEWTYGRYMVTHREEGLPIIAIQTIYDNNEVDCSGNQIDQTDEALIAFLKHDGNQMQWCADSEGLECSMSLNRVLP